MTPDDARLILDQVQVLLREARELDQWALDVRARIGDLVLQVPVAHRQGLAIAAGTDPRMIELCLSLACGRRARRLNPAGPGATVPRRH